MGRSRHDAVVPIAIFQIREAIISKNDIRVSEMNDRIIKCIETRFGKLDFQDASRNPRCVFKLSEDQERLINKIKEVYGLSLTSLYIHSVLSIAEKEGIIYPV